MKPTPIVFFGGSPFALPTLRWLVHDSTYRVVAIVTTDNNKSEIIGIAHQLDIPLLQPSSLKGNDAFLTQIKGYNAELGIIVSYGKIIPIDIINIFPMGMLNIHPSLLPKYRGPSPIQYALKNRDSITGVTIMKIDEYMDHGPLLAQTEYIIPPHQYYSQLRDILAEKGAHLLAGILPKYLAKEITPTPQPEEGISITKMITTNDAKITPQDSAEQAEAKVRAFNPNPGAFIIIQNKRIRILRASIANLENTSIQNGDLFLYDKNLYLQFQGGQLLLEEVQKEGGMPMNGITFAHGHQNLIRK